MRGTVEVDETYFGGKEKNKLGRGPVGKTAVVGAKNRQTKTVSPKVVGTGTPPAPVLRDFVEDTAKTGSTVYSDGAWAYKTMTGFTHASVAPQPRRVRAARCPHQRDRELLVDPQARLHGHLPLAEPEAPPAVHRRVLLAHQRPRAGYWNAWN